MAEQQQQQQPTEAASPVPEQPADIGQLVPDDDGDSAYEEDTGGSDTTSLKSSIMRYRQENGRTYHAYKDGTYLLPNDDRETERLDFQHHIFAMTFDGKLQIAPLPETLNRVLDIGTGTGIWAIDFADENPDTQITGLDLSPIQPPFVPPNVEFSIDDIEDEWAFSTKFDYVFSRFMTGSVVDWPKLFRQAYDNLNPGGVIELQDIIWTIASDDDTVDKDLALIRWADTLRNSMAEFKRPLDSALFYKDQLAAAGFVDIVEIKYKWPTNRWPKDPKHKEIGLWSYENISSGMNAFSLAILTRPKTEGGLGWSVEEMEVFLTQVRKDLKNPAYHGYWPIYVVYAKKPE